MQCMTIKHKCAYVYINHMNYYHIVASNIYIYYLPYIANYELKIAFIFDL